MDILPGQTSIFDEPSWIDQIGKDDAIFVSWSGGKDSTCVLLKHLEMGHKVIATFYIPYFTNDISLITKRHFDFIFDARERLEKMGAEIHQAYGRTYWEFFHHRSTRGEHKGRMFCFPCYITGKCNFRGYSKKFALDSEERKFRVKFCDIGIAFNESKRKPQLIGNKVSILNEIGFTNKMAYEYVKRNDFLSPHYEISRRDGCALCPQGEIKKREAWFADYPQAREMVIEMQRTCMIERPGMTPLRDHKWFIPMDVQPYDIHQMVMR